MRKKAITIIACEDTYKNLASFQTIDDLNETVRKYKEKFATQLSKSAKLILDHIHRYSAKYFGCSFKSKAHIAESLNISRRTVIRACQLLEQLGIIKQYEMKRSTDMLQTSNCIVIQPIVIQDKPQTQENCHTKTTPSLKQNQKDIRTDESVRKDSTPIIPSWVNKKFANLASNFMQPKQIEELWRIATIHSKMNELPSNSLVDASIDGLRCLVYKYKKGRIKGSMNGYYNGIMRNICRKMHIADLFNSAFES